ncbi:hypothetical protein BX070DRAFT_229930 [Coemansia spiralis]|nr:hypothetical protein BX070DRAFT_229930 [Coemansia spiralis]
MRITVSTPIATYAMLAAAQGSLLSKLLGDIELQLNLCPELVIDIGHHRSSGQNAKPVTQSTNPACPNYVPPDLASLNKEQPSGIEQSLGIVSTSSGGASSGSTDNASDSTDNAPGSTDNASGSTDNTPSTSAITDTDIGIGTIIEIPEVPPAAQSSAPQAYSMIPLDELLPTQVLAELQAEKTEHIPAAAPSQPKCVWVTTTVAVNNQPMPQVPNWPETGWHQAAPTLPLPDAKIMPEPMPTWMQANEWPAGPQMFTQQINTAATMTVQMADGQQG